MVKKSLLTLGACIALAIGLLGLLIPIIPGLLFLLLAAALLCGASDRLRRRCETHPRLRPYLLRFYATESLGPLERLRAAALLLFAAATDSLRR